ncbi:MAG TPA: zinc-ribbon domain-containing protein [Longimicrobiales bacterium]|nr:zinc-ribbon domain-containing protein [Longimicrobiales bacterium]
MVITVSCPSCHTSFPVDPNKVPVGGVSARCSSCTFVFRVERPQEEAPAAAPVPELAPTPEATFEATAEAETGGPVETEAPTSIADESDWALERSNDLDPGSLNIEPMDTVQSSMEEHRLAQEPVGPDLADPMALPPLSSELDFAPPPREAEREPEREPEPEPEPTPQPEAEAPAVTGFSFGKRDPKEKARRLARVLVSDMISYNPERHERAMANGSLKADFEEEIQKSWKEYVEQVGEEMANENSFWVEALNDVLARGEQIF